MLNARDTVNAWMRDPAGWAVAHQEEGKEQSA